MRFFRDGIEYFVTCKCNVVSKMLDPNKIFQSGSRTRALWVKSYPLDQLGCYLSDFPAPGVWLRFFGDGIEYFVSAKLNVVF